MSESRDTHELRFTEEFSKFIETFSASSTIAVSPKLEQQGLHRVLYDSHAGELRSCQFFFYRKWKLLGKHYFLLNHTLVLIAPPFLMTSRMVERRNIVGTAFYQNECFTNLQTIFQTWTVNGKLLYLLNSYNCLSLLLKRRSSRFTLMPCVWYLNLQGTP